MKRLTFRQKLFLYYSLIVFLVIVLGFGAVYAYIVDRLKAEVYQNMELSAKEMTGQLDNKLREMDRLTIEVVSNPFIQQYMQKLKKSGQPGSLSNMQNMASNTLISISAVNLGSLRVSIYNSFGSYTGIGIPDDPLVIDERMQRKDYKAWYESIMPESSTNKRLVLHDDYWGKQNRMISAVREIVDIDSYASYGLVEVQYPVKGLADLFEGPSEQEQYLLAGDGTVIYAGGDVGQDGDVLKQIISKIGSNEKGRFETEELKDKSYVCYEKSENSDWYFAVVKPAYVLREAVFPVVWVALLIAIILLAVMVVFTALIAERLTQPLKKLQERVRYAERTQEIKMVPETEEKDEIRMINTAFESLYKNLQLSRDELSYIKLQEAKTQMLAVQAQMNPHFLYNILSVISAISLDYQATEIMDICKYLSNMLRYAGAFSLDMVSMEEEIVHTTNYLELMKCRYKDRISYEIRADEDTKKLRVPKLILQPIVENCFRHGFKGVKPPWKLLIEIEKSEDKWLIRVSDNGTGFGEEAIAKLYRQLEHWQDNLSDDIYSLGIGGYGLTNVIIRLKIAYGREGVFRVTDRNEETGQFCIVEIGGEIHV